jgi:DNA-binding PadR family transcriptional regulator
MPRTGQTEVAVLGALSVMPMSGYALRNAIRDVLGHFWSESFGQIYPTLTYLADEGFVRREGAERTGASTFVLTDSGRTRLRELLSEPPQTTPPRNGLLLRLFFGRQLGVQGCRGLLLQAKAEAEARLEMFGALRDEVTTDEEAAQDRPYWLLTISAGEHSTRAALTWAEASLAALDSVEQEP